MEIRSLPTYLSEKDVSAVVSLLGNEIRYFYSSLTLPFESSLEMSGDLETTNKILLSVRPVRDHFINQPDDFNDENLVDRGSDFRTAHQNSVRIEVRRTSGISGAAQIAARGIPDFFRDKALSRIRNADVFQSVRLVIKSSGKMSLEVNVQGVNKALPIRYFLKNWSALLDQIQYQPSRNFDANLFKTWVAADGDGTLYGAPQVDLLPKLTESPAYHPLENYLSRGGIFLLISGNSLERTIDRVQNSLPVSLRKQFLISANGGADFGYFDTGGNFKIFSDYISSALTENSEQVFEIHDGIYIGDDGSLEGNDFAAYKYLGVERSFLVGKPMIPNTYVCVKEHGVHSTAMLLTTLVSMMNSPQEPLFSGKNRDNFLEQVRKEC